MIIKTNDILKEFNSSFVRAIIVPNNLLEYFKEKTKVFHFGNKYYILENKKNYYIIKSVSNEIETSWKYAREVNDPKLKKYYEELNELLLLQCVTLSRK